MGALTLARVAPLSERYEIQSNAGVPNGAGGRRASTWETVATVRGRAYAPRRLMNSELTQGGAMSDPNVSEIALDVASVDGSARLHCLDNGFVYEIISVASGPVSIVRARRVS